MPKDASHRWCLLIHTLPARPLYLRARIRRLLSQSGAAPIKKSVYALPNSAEALNRLRAIAVEIEAAGGSAFVCEATFPDDEVDRSVVRAYNEERHATYRDWVTEASALRGRSSAAVPRGKRANVATIARMRERLAALRALDRFQAPGSGQAIALLAHLERLAALPAARAHGARLTGLTWVTRRGLHVDRLACAWVVRRFVDPAAAFRFVASPDAPLAAREIGFDMPGAAITHENGLCSVETLMRRAAVTDPAVARIAEIVHDIDLKDARHQHAETAGFEQMLLGVIATNPQDDDRLARGLDLFDALYAALSRGVTMPSGARLPRVQTPPSLSRRVPRVPSPAPGAPAASRKRRSRS